jgi:hypothetical protein
MVVMRSFGLLLLLCLSGCIGNTKLAPFGELIPVKGHVLRGGTPVSGGAIQFNTTGESYGFLTNGVVGSDGSFTLTTVRVNDSKGERKPGVPAGVYNVIYTPAREDRTKQAFVAPDVLPTPVMITAGQDNLMIELPPKN